MAGIISWFFEDDRKEAQKALPPALPPPEEKEPSPIDKARDQFKCAHYCNEFRTVAFIHPFMPDRQDYLRALRDDDAGASWTLSVVRTEENDAQGPTTSLLPPMKTGVNFLEAMEEIAIYEQGERARGALPAQSVEDLGDLHYRRAGQVEGLIFNTQGTPRPTWRGQVIVPDDYPPDVWAQVNVRPDLTALSRDTVASTMRRMTYSMTAQHVAATEKISLGKHYSRLLGDIRNKEQIRKLIKLQEQVTSYHSSMYRQLEELEQKVLTTNISGGEYNHTYAEIFKMCKPLVQDAKELAMSRDLHGLFKDIGILDDPAISSLQALMMDQMANSIAFDLQVLRSVEKNEYLNNENRKWLLAELNVKLCDLEREKFYKDERYQPLWLLQFADVRIPVMSESYKITEALHELNRHVLKQAERHEVQALTSLKNEFNDVAYHTEPLVDSTESYDSTAEKKPENRKPSSGGGVKMIE